MSEGFLQRGALWVAGQTALMAAVAVLGGIFRGGRFHPAVLWFGGALLFLGICFGITGVIALGRQLTALPKPAAGARLVRTGIYRIMRHPLYTAVLMGSLGWTLICQSWPALIATICLALFLDAKARREERWLRGQFPDYASYSQRVRRFIPGIY